MHMQVKLMVAAMLCCICLHVSSAQKGYRQGGNSTATLKGKDANQTRDTDPSPSSDRRLSVIAAALDGRLRLQSGDCSHLVHAIYERAGFPYQYASSSDLYAGVQEFQRVRQPRRGDLVVWRGHVGIVIKPSRHMFFSFLRSGPGMDDYGAPYWKKRGQARFYRYAKASTLDFD